MQIALNETVTPTPCPPRVAPTDRQPATNPRPTARSSGGAVGAFELNKIAIDRDDRGLPGRAWYGARPRPACVKPSDQLTQDRDPRTVCTQRPAAEPSILKMCRIWWNSA